MNMVGLLTGCLSILLTIASVAQERRPTWLPCARILAFGGMRSDTLVRFDEAVRECPRDIEALAAAFDREIAALPQYIGNT
jgi:hypothetical protein